MVEVPGVLELLDKGITDYLLGLVMMRVVGEYLLMQCPVFIELGREFYEVSRNGSSRQGGILLLGKESMQCMAKLMEESFYLAIGKQAGKCLGRRGVGWPSGALA